MNSRTLVYRLSASSLAVALASLAFPSLASATPITTVYSYTGANQDWTVPDGVTSLQVSLWGAGGGGGSHLTSSGSGAAGAYITGTLGLTPGESLVLVVGGGGSSGISAPGGFGGGGAGKSRSGDPAGGGGGYSGIFQTSVSGANALAVAGGGGGAYAVTNGIAPTLTAGDGSNLTGGSSSNGGGGGGGYNGGAAGNVGPGAGSFLSDLTNSSASAAPTGAAAVGTSDPNFLSTADGAGGVGSGNSGLPGEVVITYEAAVPEPASLSLMALAAGTLLVRRRRVG